MDPGPVLALIYRPGIAGFLRQCELSRLVTLEFPYERVCPIASRNKSFS
jgi:hypothetical protein